MNITLPKKKIDTIREEHDFFTTLFQERLKEFVLRSREVDDEDRKTLIRLELVDYRNIARSLLLSKQYLLTDEELASLCEHMTTVRDIEEETEHLLRKHGIRNTLAVIQSLESTKQRICLRALSTALLDVVRA